MSQRSRSDPGTCDAREVEWCELAGVVVVTSSNDAFERLVRELGPGLKLIVLPRDKAPRGVSGLAEQCRQAAGVVVRIKHMNHNTTDMLKKCNNNIVIVDNGREESLIDALRRVHRGYEKRQGPDLCSPG